MEHQITNTIEAEIAELSRQIEVKKQELESRSGIVHEAISERELVATAVAENFYPTSAGAPVSPVGSSTATAPSVGDDYLKTLPPEMVEKVNHYISLVPTKGIREALTQVISAEPFLIDAFHDALVTNLYEELKERGIVK